MKAKDTGTARDKDDRHSESGRGARDKSAGAGGTSVESEAADDLDDLAIELGPAQVCERGETRPPDAGRIIVLGHPSGEPLVRLWWKALRQVIDQAAANPGLEVAGLLVGDCPADEGRLKTHIWDALPGQELPASPVEVTLTHEAWQKAAEEVWAREDGAQVVGWYHTHPGFGVFLSTADRFIAEHFFSAPGQVSLVYDNRRRQLGLFARRRGSVAALPGVELALGHEAAELGWQELRYCGGEGLLLRLLKRLTSRPGTFRQ